VCVKGCFRRQVYGTLQYPKKLGIYRAFLSVSKALLSLYRALLSIDSALLGVDICILQVYMYNICLYI